MLIVVSKSNNYINCLVPYFIEGDIERPDPLYAPFKCISCVDMNWSSDEVCIKNLELINNACACINSLFISDKKLKILCELNISKIRTLKVKYLYYYKQSQDEISNEAVEIFNEINPNTIVIYYSSKCSFEDLKVLSSLNSPNIEANFKIDGSFIFDITLVRKNRILV